MLRKRIVNIKHKAIAYACSFVALLMSFAFAGAAWAESLSFGVSPMRETIVLSPGDTYVGKFKIINYYSDEFKYSIKVTPFTVDSNYASVLEGEIADSNQIVNWTTLDVPETGIVSDHGEFEVVYSVEVPENAPAGGQYMGITVTSSPSENAIKEGSFGINESLSIGYLVFAEIAGDTIRNGEIKEVNVPSFLLDGNITASASIKNTGNVHGDAKYTLQVFPLFSNEEVYTNEENPDTKTILPDKTLYNELSWKETPPVGIFNVVYTVEFEGVTTQVSKMVIKCPIWLLFIVIFAIVAIVIYFVVRAKARKSSKARKEHAEAE